MSTEPVYKSPDLFDRKLGALVGLPDVTKTAPSTVVAHTPLIGEAQTFIVQTFRRAGEGDTIFLQYMDATGSVRIVIPPQAAEAIARQRDALTTKGRRLRGKEQAAQRKARGELPGFLKGRKPKPKGKP